MFFQILQSLFHRFRYWWWCGQMIADWLESVLIGYIGNGICLAILHPRVLTLHGFALLLLIHSFLLTLLGDRDAVV